MKILIDNEEVVSGKDFTITEEMLNTPSVILNNVYPKAWENDKDYISRFYYPKDYSKCLIYDSDENLYPYTVYGKTTQETIEGEEGTTVEGQEISITDYDSSKEHEILVEGESTQEGTPTPKNPQEIETVTGNQEIVVCGKNLFDIAKLENSGWKQPHVSTRLVMFLDKVPQGTKMSATNKDTTNYRFSIGFTKLGYASSSNIMVNESGWITTSTYTVTARGDGYPFLQISRIDNGNISASEVEGKFQFEYSDTPTTYEAYKEQTYSINLGDIELCKIGTYQDTIVKDNGKWYLHKETHKMVLNGTEKGWTYDSTNKYFRNPSYNFGNNIPLEMNNANKNTYMQYMNLFKINKSWSGANSFRDNVNVQGEFYPAQNSGYKVMFRNLNIDNVTDLQAWLSTHNVINYYPLATPTNTEITNEELIEQLEELYNDEFFDGVNNISTSGIYLNLHYNYVTSMPSTERPSQMINLTGNVELEIEGNTYRLSLGENELCSNKDETIRDFIQKDEDDKWYINKRIGIIEEYNGEEITTEYMSTTGELTIGTKVQYVLENIEKEEITDETLIRQLESIGNLLIFSGIVKNSGKISLNPRYPHFCDLQILDFKMFLSEVILDFVIANKTIKEAIQQVTSFISSYGFVLGNIELNNPNEMIGAYSTKDKSPYDVFNYIADITQSRWTTRMVDQDTVAIDFYNPELMEQGTAIEYTTQWFEDNKIDDISYSYGTYDYRNKQIMTSDEVMANISSIESIYANGYQTQYNTEKKIGNVSSITLNGISKTITTNENKELGQTADFYYTVGNNYIESETPLSAGDTIVINYIAIVQGRQIITNSTEINRVANSTGRNGTLARYENRNDATTSDELQKIGQSYIKYKGTPEIKLNISTRNNIWEIGQKVEFNAPITELSTEYMVKRKDVKYITTIDTIFYTYELTSSFNSEREINYFDNQRAKNKGNIGEGEYVSRNIDIENTTNIIFYDSSIEEVETIGDNILDSVLDSPLNN